MDTPMPVGSFTQERHAYILRTVPIFALSDKLNTRAYRAERALQKQ